MNSIHAYDWFKKWAVYHPEKIAIKEYETDRTYTYKQINDLANRTVIWLQEEYQISTGDRVAVLADNCLEYIVLLSAAQKSGIILVPLNYRLVGRELDFMIRDSEPMFLLVEDKYAAKINDLPAIGQVKKILPLKAYTDFLGGEKYKGTTTQQADFEEDHPLFIIYTSGTTAYPKGAIYSHKMFFWNCINTAIRLEITTNDRALNCAPPFHTGGWNVLQSTFILFGGYTLLMKSFDADGILDALENDEHTIFWGVPTMLKMMAASKNFATADLSKIRYFVLGGEAMPIPLIETYHAKGVPIRQGYGLTEVGPNVYSLDHSQAIRKQGSIGTPNFFYEVRLVDSNGVDVPNNIPGELIIKAPTVTPGYWKNPEATENTIVDGWFHTGDLIKKDDEGYYYVVDRIKNMYISGGENVYPAEVEHLIRTHEYVRDCAIIGVPDEKWGETGKAFVVLKDGCSLTQEILMKYCLKNLAKYKTPKYVEFIDALPLNNAGKVDRRLLKRNNKEINKETNTENR